MQLLVYNFGQVGLDLVNSPVHVQDGHLELCQNAQVSPHDLELAIKKRDGMTKLNETVMDGPILAIANISLAEP